MATTPEGGSQLRVTWPIAGRTRALGGSGRPAEVVERVAVDQHIPESVQDELLPSGKPRFPNQVAFARLYLVREGLVDSSKHGVWTLTERGRDAPFTGRGPGNRRAPAPRDTAEPPDGEDAPDDPDEPEAVHPYSRAEVIQLLLGLPAAGFEQLCRRILREAGSVQVTVTGRSGDQGIDGHGTLQMNMLVSFQVLFQCKRYKESVSPSHVRDFRGAMSGRADKGLIITTGTFTAEARREASRDGVVPIELIDGDKLVSSLESLELGLKKVTTYQIDRPFFSEFGACLTCPRKSPPAIIEKLPKKGASNEEEQAYGRADQLGVLNRRGDRRLRAFGTRKYRS